MSQTLSVGGASPCGRSYSVDSCHNKEEFDEDFTDSSHHTVKSTALDDQLDLTKVGAGMCGGLAPNLVSIVTRWDESGTFSDQIQYRF